MAKKITKKEAQGSVTFQLSEARKTIVEEMAFKLGLRRVADGKERGNSSAVLNLFVEYVVENKDLFAAWVSKRITG